MAAKINTRYTLEVAGELTEFSKSTKATVVAEAQKVHKDTKVAVRVVTQTGFIAFELKETKPRVITRFTKPYTKTVTLPEELRALVPEGYAPAYMRLRNGAVVLRNEDADDESLYAVMDTATGEIAGYTPTTRAAGVVMKAMKKTAAVA